MKTMKHTFLYLGLGAFVLLAPSCQKAELEEAAKAGASEASSAQTGGAGEFTGAFEDGTRATLDNKTVTWIQGDLIDVMVDGNGNDGRNKSTISGYDFRLGYRYKTESEGPVVGFDPYSTTVPTSSVYYALHPYIQDGESSKGIIHCWLPQYQWGKDGDFSVARNNESRIAAFSVGKTTSKSTPFVFRNVSTLMRFTVPSSMAGKITKIRVATPFGEYLSGDLYIDASKDEPEVGFFGNKFTGESVQGVSKQDHVHLFPGAPGAGGNDAPTDDTFAAGTYVLALVPGNYYNGFDVEYTTNDGKTWRRSKRAGITTLTRNTIYDMGELTVPGNVAVSGSGGVTALPYVFSFYHKDNADGTPKYITYSPLTSVASPDTYLTGGKGEVSGIVATANTTGDNSGATLQLNATYSTASSAPSFNTNCWKENLCRDNVNVAGWAVNSQYGGGLSFECGAFLSIPMQVALPSAFNISFGLSASNNWCAKNYAVYYTSDKDSWWCHAGTVSIDKARESGANYYFYSVDVPSSGVQVAAGQMLYVKIVPVGNKVVGGGGSSGIGNTAGSINLHSAVAITPIAEGATETPSGNVVLWQPFDKLTSGAPFWYNGSSYRERLAGLANFPGTVFSSWTSAQKKPAAGSATGEFTANGYVCSRPGFVQVSTAPSDVTTGLTLTNHLGSFTTPALGVAGTLNVSFKAMRYLNPANSRFSTQDERNASNCNDIKSSESLSYWIGIVGGGTIASFTRDGSANGTIGIEDSGWTSVHTECSSYIKYFINNCDSWHNFNMVINNATANTKILFTAHPSSDNATNWFTRFYLDDILVTH